MFLLMIRTVRKGYSREKGSPRRHGGHGVTRREGEDWVLGIEGLRKLNRKEKGVLRIGLHGGQGSRRGKASRRGSPPRRG